MSSKTRKVSAKKIKSEHRLLLVGLAGIAVASLGLLLFARWSNSQHSVTSVTLTNYPVQKAYCLKLSDSQDNCSATLEAADTDASRVQGLSGRPSMKDDRGMIFVFGQPAVQCMWMKDMRFVLDIIWINSEKQVTKIEKNVSPDSYPKEFCSVANDKYVLELTAGSSGRLGINTGQKLLF